MTPPSDYAPTPPPSSAPLEVVTPVRIQERRAFGFLALVALAAIVRLAMPVGIGLFLGALLGFTLEPIYGRLRKKRIKAGPAALLCALGATLLVSGIVLGLSTLIVTRGIALLASLREQLAPGGALRAFAEASAARLAALHLNVADVSQRLENEAVSLGSSAAGIAAQVAGVTFGGLLMLFFMTLMAYFVLHHWRDLVARAERMLPFERRHTHALLEQFRTVGREVLLGTVVTGLAQGFLAAIGYWITGVPEPAFFGALTAVASLIPGVGTLLVWVPIGLVRMATGHPGAGLVELIYSAATVGIVCDYLLRPLLVGREKGVPSILTFIALFGGVEVFGVIGLILGPVLVTLSFAILKTYEREATAVPASTA
ncbi:MAG: AI-2E family transporter [Myxococcota bacterium]|nr:AI-2E family transporter [Myxococcota bacterium]